jgi:serine/threonine protein kinase
VNRNAALPDELVESAIEGATVDWQGLASRADGEQQRLLDHLRFVSSLAALHRLDPDEINGDAEQWALRYRQVTNLPARPPAATRTLAFPRQHWGHFELLERIGEGSFGEVYRARDTKLLREVAIKLLKPEAASDRSIRTRVLSEGRALARVDDPSVVRIHSVEEHDGRIGLCMEYVRGKTLEDVLDDQGPMSAPEAAHVGQEVCRALAAVHRVGLLHRDVKTRNVMRAEGGRIVLMDFGAGMVTDAGATARVTGTPVYLAPEVLNGAPATPQSDLYSLGVLLFRLVTSEYPVTGSSIDDLRLGHRTGPRRQLADLRPDLPATFIAAVESALDSRASNRPASAGALKRALAVDTRARTWLPRRLAWTLALTSAAALALLLYVVGLPREAGIASTSSEPPRVVVFPLSSSPAAASEANELSRELIALFEQVSAIRVISWQTARLLGPCDVARAIRDFNATWIVCGGQGTTPAPPLGLRVILASTGTTVWEHSSPGERLASPGAAPIARAALAKMGISITPEESKRLAVRRQQSPQARQRYLDARQLLDGGPANVQNMSTACRELDAATAADSGYAPAFVTLAGCYTLLEEFGGIPRPTARTTILAALQAARNLEPESPESLTHFANVRFYYDWNWSEAESLYRQAVALGPSSAFARERYARFLAAEGRINEAVETASEVERLNPIAASTRALGIILYYASRYEDALAQYRAQLAVAPNSTVAWFGYGRVLAETGDYEKALEAFRRATAIDPPATYVAEIARTYAAAGRPAEARAVLAKLPQGWEETVPASAAYVAAALGDRDATFRLIDRAIERRHQPILWAKVDPRLRMVRDDPRFLLALRRIGVPP